MWPLSLCSLISIYLFVDRFFRLRPSQVISGTFGDKIIDLVGEGKEIEAQALCKHENNILARVFLRGLNQNDRKIDILKETLQGQGVKELANLKESIHVLSTISYISPLIGLLGTVLGMMDVFGKLTSDPESLSNPQVLSQGINEALITTAAGLLVAIPAFIFFRYLQNRIQVFAVDLEEKMSRFLVELVKSGENKKPLSGA